MRKRKRYVVQLHDQHIGDEFTYGPYTERQAEVRKRKLEQKFRREAKNDPEGDVDQYLVSVGILLTLEEAGEL